MSISSLSFGLIAAALSFVLFLGMGTHVRAQNSVASICHSVATTAGRESGVPIDVLRAISLTETGRTSHGKFEPWPWTVNMEGVGKWFASIGEAQNYVLEHFNRGARSFDVGCFQINYKWHGQAFSSVEDMFDPLTNARYAASFLRELYDEFGDWSRAAGAYHSRTPALANKYSIRFDRIRSRLSDWAPPSNTDTDLAVATNSDPKSSQRKNNFPLLVSTQMANGPSLVPLKSSRGALFDMGGNLPFWENR